MAYFFVPKELPEYVKSAILVVGFFSAAVVFFVSPTGKSFLGYANESYREARKVVWPTQRSAANDRGCFCFCRCDVVVFVGRG